MVESLTKSTPTLNDCSAKSSALYVCALLADVASTEQQQSAKDSSKAHEEEEVEHTSMGAEEQEELRALDAEPLRPEEVKSGSTAQPGEQVCGEHPLPPELRDSTIVSPVPFFLRPNS